MSTSFKSGRVVFIKSLNTSMVKSARTSLSWISSMKMQDTPSSDGFLIMARSKTPVVQYRTRVSLEAIVSYRTLWPTSVPSGFPLSSETRSANEIAAMRRGWQQITLYGASASSSLHQLYLAMGSWVDFPQPVAPTMTVTLNWSMASLMTSCISYAGNVLLTKFAVNAFFKSNGLKFSGASPHQGMPSFVKPPIASSVSAAAPLPPCLPL
mmetsp:Transcript_22519/g.51555  ORF Transcript_22519/g.51555 Transcript_22519/m.51555 type:complete len:210 (+) Transcript_22519:807-1436(+)